MRRIFNVRENEQLLTLDPTFYEIVVPVLDAINVCCEDEDCHVTIESGYRSMEQQAKEFAKGRTAPGPRSTNARPGYSPHQYRLAIHAVLRHDAPNEKDGLLHWLPASDKRWHTIVAEMVEGIQLLTWGGRFKRLFDAAHIEMVGWDSVAERHGWKEPEWRGNVAV